MPKIQVDDRTLDGIVIASLRDQLNTLVDFYRQTKLTKGKEKYADDIRAIEHVLKIYGA